MKCSSLFTFLGASLSLADILPCVLYPPKLLYRQRFFVYSYGSFSTCSTMLFHLGPPRPFATLLRASLASSYFLHVPLHCHLALSAIAGIHLFDMFFLYIVITMFSRCGYQPLSPGSCRLVIALILQDHPGSSGAP